VSGRLQWGISTEDGCTTVAFRGPVNEDSDFDALKAEIKSGARIRFDMSEIGRVNSCGVREWVNFVRSLPSTCTLELDKCPPAVVSQLNMISNFAGGARVLSVHAPFVCPQCGGEESVLVQVERGRLPELPERQCRSCSSAMEFDDVEDSYFAFLR
jgi:hypothetical protein